ncbi:MAG: Tex family protein [bacterium]
MNDDLIKKVSTELNVPHQDAKATLLLLEAGNTVPFISRYRKEATHGLDEEMIRAISDAYEYAKNLTKKKEDIKRLIDEKGLLTDDLVINIDNATKLVELEDIYRPFKEKKKTKATDAIAAGLEPLAKMIMAQPTEGSILEMASKFVGDKVKDEITALEGAGYIIAEWISDNAFFRKYIRDNIYNYGTLKTKIKKDAIDENKTYEMYYDFSEKICYAKSYRILAINRAEKEKIISVSIDFEKGRILDFIESKVIKNNKSFVCDFICDAIKDSFKRLIYPSIEREIRSLLTENADLVAIENFGDNLKNLLMQPPMKEKIVLALDPAYRTGCKLAVLDKNGAVLKIEKIYPHAPVNKINEAKKIVVDLINKYSVNIVAIGNGTASRESEEFIASLIGLTTNSFEYIIVSEAGASVYSASKLAISEFPNYRVEERSAVSIGRRLQDPLSELVKIDPESIGVGLYQHDVQNKLLKESLDFVVTSSVNSVGVNVNTASVSLFKYVSGITAKTAEKLINEREKIGKINSRLEVKKMLTPKVYEQAIGFLRINDGDNLLDETDIHPESYDVTLKILTDNNLTINDIGSEKISNYNFENKYDVDNYTFNDIIESLKKPKRDPRDVFDKPVLKSTILHLEDLKIGDELEGTVRNVVDFGAFIDIGLKNDGLVHISKISKDFIKHPSEKLAIGQIVKCYVEKVDIEKKKVSLSMLEV